MFRKTLSSLIIFGVCSTPLMALAQQNDGHHDDYHQNDNNHQNDYHQNDNNHENNYHQNDNNHQNNNFNGHQNNYQNNNHQNYVHHNEWKHGYHMRSQDWNRGQRVDYHTYHLSAPPRGYEWREVDGNYVMAAVATGVIASVIAASVR